MVRGRGLLCAVLRIRRGLPPEFYAAAVLILVSLVFAVSEFTLLGVFLMTGRHGWLEAATWEIRGLYITCGLTAVVALLRMRRNQRLR